MVAAYRHHKRGLQIMQSRAPGQWLLKFPSHAPFLDALLTVYPDARIVLTHRDPIKPLGSSCSASHHLTAQFNTGLDTHHVGRETVRILDATLRKMCALRSTHPHVEVHDMHYQRLVTNPINEIKRLYAFLGQTLAESVHARMDAAIATHNARRAVVGPNRYGVAEFGLAVDQLPAIFSDYVRQFGIEREG